MVNINLSVPDDLKKQMENLKFVNWNSVIKEAIREEIRELKVLDLIADKSKITEKDALEISREIKKSMWKKYKE